MAKDGLNPKQQRFCELYASDREFFGNGTDTYVEVYKVNKANPNWEKVAASAASRLLRNVKISDKINSLLQEGGLNDQFVDKQLLFLINQHAEFQPKLGAIKEYNKLRGRITDIIDNRVTLPTPIGELLKSPQNVQSDNSVPQDNSPQETN